MAIIQQMGIDAKILRDSLSTVEVGQTITYEQMTATIGRDIIRNRSILETARRSLMADNKVFATVRGEGIQRVDDSKKIQLATANLGRIRNITRKSSKTLQAVSDFEALPNDMKIQHNATMSVCGAILQASKSSSLKKVEKVLQNNNQVLPVADTLKLFQV